MATELYIEGNQKEIEEVLEFVRDFEEEYNHGKFNNDEEDEN